MADSQSLTPQHMVQAARRYYLDDVSKVRIGEEMGISRFKVARLLEAAKDAGIVRIEVIDPTTGHDQLARDLVSTFGLTHARVVDVDGLATDDERRTRVAQVAGELLRTVIEPTDVLGLPWSRMVARTVPFLDGLPPIPIVQLSGALDLPGEETSPVDIVRDAARLTGGEAHVFYAPFVASDAAAAQVIRDQPSVSTTLAEARHCSVAVVGVGGWAPEESTLHDLASPEERQELTALDTVGEIAGALFDSTGTPIEAALTDRLVALDARLLRNISRVIAVTQGVARADAVLAGLRGGYLSGLVVDTALAEAVLERG